MESAAEKYEADEVNERQWREWHVSFQDAEEMVTELGLPTDFEPKLFNEETVSRYTDKRGEFKAQVAKEAWMKEQVAPESPKCRTEYREVYAMAGWEVLSRARMT